MAERKLKLTMPDGKVVQGVEVPVAESSEKWSEFTLEDGSVIRAKLSVLSFTRIDGEYDQDGNPVYVTKSSPIQVVVSAPDALRRKAH